jgi:hypothetical protein
MTIKILSIAMQLMCFDSKMVAVPRLLIFSQLVASLTATDMGEKKTKKKHKFLVNKSKNFKFEKMFK